MSGPDELLAALERVREVRGSLPLFDGLVRDDADAVAAALRDAPRHPLRGPIAGWLHARGRAAAGPPDAAAILARRGISDLDAFLDARDAELVRLGRLLADARAESARHARNASAFAAICVLLAAAAVAGWALALGTEPEPASTPPTEDPR